MENNKFLFEPQTQVINGVVFATVHPTHTILRKQREALGLTQQAVADAAKIKFRQYERYESGERSLDRASFRIGVGICRVLKINPFDVSRNSTPSEFKS